MNWVLTIGVDKFYLTEQEKESYLKAVNIGVKYVQIRGMILGTSFQSLVQKQALEGKWQCEWGKWHEKNGECMCGYDYVPLQDGTYRKIEKPVSELMEISEGKE